MITVKDGPRTLTFDGKKIAHSSSFDPGKTRWIEFHLYITTGGTYVLSRIGASRLVHTIKCDTVLRNKIKEVPSNDVNMDNAIICPVCRKTGEYSTVIYPEVPRYWVSVTDSADTIVDNLYKEDQHGNLYLTDVARRLLEDASKEDSHIADVFMTEHIY